MQIPGAFLWMSANFAGFVAVSLVLRLVLPSLPFLPSFPGSPFSPSTPSRPFLPGRPSNPGSPGTPSLPSKPAGPCSPFSPFGPGNPKTHAGANFLPAKVSERTSRACYPWQAWYSCVAFHSLQSWQARRTHRTRLLGAELLDFFAVAFQGSFLKNLQCRYLALSAECKLCLVT